MIIALYIVAFAMVGGGLAALVQGLPYIMVERGWAMVIAGTVAASGGAVLAGIAVAAGRLGRIQDELSSLRERTGRPDGALPETRLVSPEPRASPSLPGAGVGEESAAGLDFPAGELGSRAAVIAPSPSPEARGPIATAPAGDAGPPAPAPETRIATAAERPAPLEREAAASPPEPPRPDPPAPAEEPTVIGTYSSGGNSYVMFSDGSIQADTPTGAYRFKSLDELKDFIAAGGEGETAARA